MMLLKNGRKHYGLLHTVLPLSLFFLLATWLPGYPLMAEEFRTASPFQDKMVLQRGKTIPVWGWADPGDNVTVSIAGSSGTGVTDTKGTWTVNLPPLSPGGPHTFTVQRGSDTITYMDVLVGDVWLASGQSNMEWNLEGQVINGTLYSNSIINENLPIRHLEISNAVAFSPQKEGAMTWEDNNPLQWSAVATIFAWHLQKSANVPIGIIEASLGGTSIEGWMPMDMTQDLPHFDRMMRNFYNSDNDENDFDFLQAVLDGGHTLDSLNLPDALELLAPLYIPDGDADFGEIVLRPNVFYNAMLSPVIPYGISGMIWYQGEANSGQNNKSGYIKNAQYGHTLPAFVKEYRRQFNQGDFPFLAVQLPSFNSVTWPWFRENQHRVTNVNNAFVAQTIDTGDPFQIHPKDKELVGERLALLARKYYYNEALEAHGPQFESMAISGNEVTIQFTHANGLTTNGAGDPTTFEIAGSDHVFHAATNVHINGTSVTMSSNSVSTPVAVRNAWVPVPRNEVNIYNSAGIPIEPFRTDNWTVPGLGEQRPVAVNDFYRTYTNAPLAIDASEGVLHNDMDLNYTSLSASLVSDVTNGTLTLSADGSFAYSPHEGFTGSDAFSYICSDGNLDSNPTLVTITVGAGNTPTRAPKAAVIIKPSSGTAPFNATFDNSWSRDYDGSIVSYDWNFGDGSTGSGVVTNHTYTTEGEHTATLTLTDDLGMTAVSTHTLTVAKGLILHYTMDDSSQPYLDSSGNGHDGAASGSPTWTESGQMAGALQFDGVNDQVNCGTEAGSKSAITVAFWINADNQAYMQPISKFPSSGVDTSGIGWTFKFRDDGAIWVMIGSSQLFDLSTTAPADSYLPNTWTHVAWTFSDGTSKLYLNGVQASSTTGITTSINNTTDSLKLGYLSYREKFAGKLDDVRVYDVALSASAITDIYNGVEHEESTVINLLKLCVGLPTHLDGLEIPEVNGDNKTGMEEIVHLLNQASLR